MTSFENSVVDMADENKKQDYDSKEMARKVVEMYRCGRKTETFIDFTLKINRICVESYHIPLVKGLKYFNLLGLFPKKNEVRISMRVFLRRIPLFVEMFMKAYKEGNNARIVHYVSMIGHYFEVLSQYIMKPEEAKKIANEIENNVLDIYIPLSNPLKPVFDKMICEILLMMIRLIPGNKVIVREVKRLVCVTRIFPSAILDSMISMWIISYSCDWDYCNWFFTETFNSFDTRCALQYIRLYAKFMGEMGLGDDLNFSDSNIKRYVLEILYCPDDDDEDWLMCVDDEARFSVDDEARFSVDDEVNQSLDIVDLRREHYVGADFVSV
jgi:hypothetical protein